LRYLIANLENINQRDAPASDFLAKLATRLRFVLIGCLLE
jgi:hypothetical protein